MAKTWQQLRLAHLSERADAGPCHVVCTRAAQKLRGLSRIFISLQLLRFAYEETWKADVAAGVLHLNCITWTNSSWRSL